MQQPHANGMIFGVVNKLGENGTCTSWRPLELLKEIDPCPPTSKASLHINDYYYQPILYRI